MPLIDLEEAPSPSRRRQRGVRPACRRSRRHRRRRGRDRKTQALVAANRKLEAYQAELRREMQAAAAVQQTLLPSADFSVPGLEVAWSLEPCDQLGGDLLNCVRPDENHVAFWVLDVSGHGVSAALLSVQISRLLSPLLSDAQILKARLDRPPWYELVAPNDVLRRLNELFAADDDDSCTYFTMVYGLLHQKSGRLRLATGGHPPPLHAAAGRPPNRLEIRGLPLGLLEGQRWEMLDMQLEPGDRLWLYSDGLTESENGAGVQLGFDGLSDVIGRVATMHVSEAVPEVMRTVSRRSDGIADDDCTILAVERSV